MNNQFDELAKGLAQSLTRRGALKKFTIGLAGIAVAALGLAHKAQADRKPFRCRCSEINYGCESYGVEFPNCTLYCSSFCSRGV